jgi:YVTN family beta-propeller protein
MHVRLLGPIEAILEGRAVPLGTRKQRALLAMLALRPNTTVGVDRLVEGLWGEEPPASAPKMVQLYVSQLRRCLAGGGAEIVTHGHGYELRIAADRVDAARFERLVDGGGGSQAREALALWRGPPLADVADEPFAAAEIRRLEELRLRATEAAIVCDLAAGRHRELIGELDALVAEHPLAERLHAQRMLALYRSGRQAEALEAYRRARAVLVEEIGVEPGPELRRLHEAVLRQDAALDLPTEKPAPTSAPPPVAAPPARRRARGRRALVVAAVLALVAGLAVFAVSRRSGPELQPRIDENAIGVIDPDEGGITARYPVGRGPNAVTAGGGSVWVANALDGTVSRIEGKHAAVTIPVGEDPAGLAFAAGSLWVSNRQAGTVSQIDPGANRVVQWFPVGNAPSGIAAGYGAVWVASEVDGAVTRIDLGYGTATRRIDLGANPTAIAVGAGAVWVASEEGGTVFRIDPASATVVKSIRVGNRPIAIAVGEGAVWVANRQDATVWRIDPETNSVTDTVSVGHDPSAIAVGEDGVWVANSAAGTVSRIDPASRHVADVIPVHSSPSALAVADGSIWTAALATPASHRGGTLRFETWQAGFDPGPYDNPTVTSLVYDGLLAYRRAGGATFGRLVGDLATDVPEPSPDGKTYVFTLRRNIRYSDGTPVRPEDFRASLEQLLRRHGHEIPAYYNSIAGVPECARRPARCDLSRGIDTDANQRTITLHLTEPDPELLHRLAFQFAYVAPADHPFHYGRAAPGTGPYRVANFKRDRGARLVRNPYFRVWSRDARPDGFSDEIDVRISDHIKAQATAIERGEADVAEVAPLFGGGLAPADLSALQRRGAGQLQTNATPELDYMFLNVHARPFDDVRARRAINYAVDRRAVAELAGGANLAEPTCQLVPPGFPGYAPSCPYTLDPGPAGRWIAPDLAKARRLIDQSGTRGMKVTVWGYREKQAIIRYFVGLLDRLGYRSSPRLFDNYESYRPTVADSRTRAQIGIEGWTADIGAPSNYTPPFACESFFPHSGRNQNLAQFCDHRIEAQIHNALATRGPNANALWQDMYDRLADAAPAVPLVNRRTVTFLSKRIGNYQHHPGWGTLLDQLWVH